MSIDEVLDINPGVGTSLWELARGTKTISSIPEEHLVLLKRFSLVDVSSKMIHGSTADVIKTFYVLTNGMLERPD
jgi:hypothetical protein